METPTGIIVRSPNWGPWLALASRGGGGRYGAEFGVVGLECTINPINTVLDTLVFVVESYSHHLPKKLSLFLFLLYLQVVIKNMGFYVPVNQGLFPNFLNFYFIF